MLGIKGKLGEKEVYALEGRFHFYEGYSMKEVCYPFYVLKLLGVEQVVLTNACGGINREFAPGTLMLLTDFINMMGTNPLIGPNDERFGPRFPDMTEPYSLELRNLAKQTADELGIFYQEGVYLGFMGPCYETAAEIRAFAGMGADAVGMSTVPETMVCNYLGMKVLAVSCITNMATGIQTVKHSHARVLEIANQAGETLCRWLGARCQPSSSERVDGTPACSSAVRQRSTSPKPVISSPPVRSSSFCRAPISHSISTACGSAVRRVSGSTPSDCICVRSAHAMAEYVVSPASNSR